LNILPHVLVADGLWRRFSWPDAIRPDLLAGSIAPDAYRLQPGRSFRPFHFRSRTRAGERLEDFLATHLRPALALGAGPEQAFWIGWLSHVCADGAWRRLLRAELPELWRQCLDNDPIHSSQMRLAYQVACDRVDREAAVAQSLYISELRQFLRHMTPAYDIFPLDALVFHRWITTVVADHLPPPLATDAGADELSYSFVMRAVDVSVEETIAILSSEMQRLARKPGQWEFPDHDDRPFV
jgi:hypothetical protein